MTVRSTAELDWIAAEAERFAQTGATRGRSWSLAQVCEHLALAMEGTLDEPADPVVSEPILTRAKRWFMKQALLTTGLFPANAPAPQVTIPSGRLDQQEAIQRLRNAAAAFAERLQQPNTRWVAHPLLGTMTGGQWCRFHVIHARHHFSVLTVRRRP